MSKKGLITLILIIICLGLLVGGIFGYRKYLDNKNDNINESVDKNKVENSSENISYAIKRIETKGKYIEELSEDKYLIVDEKDSWIKENNGLFPNEGEMSSCKVSIYNKNTNNLVISFFDTSHIKEYLLLHKAYEFLYH